MLKRVVTSAVRRRCRRVNHHIARCSAYYHSVTEAVLFSAILSSDRTLLDACLCSLFLSDCVLSGKLYHVFLFSLSNSVTAFTRWHRNIT